MSEIVGSRAGRLERPEAEQLVEDVDDERFALEQAERRRLRLALEHADDQAADLGLGVFARTRVSRSRFSRFSRSWWTLPLSSW